jgi:NDP-sugar pyrophosphorylase family protein
MPKPVSVSNDNSPATQSPRAGIFAAGNGQRLQTRSSELKPLVKVNGKPLIGYVLNALAEANVSEVVIIINENGLPVRDYVTSLTWPFVLRWIVETTPTSMHSFIRLVETLSASGDSGPFLISTVDTVAASHAYTQFIKAARQYDWAAVTLALTAAGDDEKPLLVQMESATARITAIGPKAAASELATAGIYAVRPSILVEAESAQIDGLDSLRAFLGRLMDRGYKLAGIPISRSIDVDRPNDIGVAEAFLNNLIK